MSDHGHQACTRTCTMDRILQQLGFLEFGRGSLAFNLIRWGPGRRIARRIYDLLKLHGKMAIPASPIDWSKSRAYTSVVSTGEGVSINMKGREPEGIWLPETAANDDTLATLIEEGLQFTVLAQQQASRWREADGRWVQTAAQPIDPRLPYRYFHRDGSGRSLVLFFYDGEIARKIAFERAGSSGEGFVDLFDEQAEDAIFGELEKLHDGGARFSALSEERGKVDFGSADVLVVIDPIDGSMNAKRGLTHHAISIGVAAGDTMGDMEFGYVFDFGPDEEWVARRGQGVLLNGAPLPEPPPARYDDGKLELVAASRMGRPLVLIDLDQFIQVVKSIDSFWISIVQLPTE